MTTDNPLIDLMRRIKAYQAHVAGAPNQERFIELCDELFAAIRQHTSRPDNPDRGDAFTRKDEEATQPVVTTSPAIITRVLTGEATLPMGNTEVDERAEFEEADEIEITRLLLKMMYGAHTKDVYAALTQRVLKDAGYAIISRAALRQPAKPAVVSLEKLRGILTCIRCGLERRFQVSDYIPDGFQKEISNRELASDICQDIMQHVRKLHEWCEKAETILQSLKAQGVDLNWEDGE